MGYDLTSLNVPEPNDSEIEKLLNDAMGGAEGDLAAMAQAGFDALASTGHYFRFNQVAWPNLLQLAVAHSWQPNKSWEEYTRQDGPVMSEADANGLADALERALITLQDVRPLQASHGPLPPTLRPPWIPDDPGLIFIGPRYDLSPAVFWAGNEEKIRRFVIFARQGPFRIG